MIVEFGDTNSKLYNSGLSGRLSDRDSIVDVRIRRRSVYDPLLAVGLGLPMYW